jgi:hypothetical protein
MSVFLLAYCAKRADIDTKSAAVALSFVNYNLALFDCDGRAAELHTKLAVATIIANLAMA